MSRRRRITLIAGGIPLAALLLLVAAWGIDTAVSGDHVIRNVEAEGGTPLGGLNRSDIEAAAADLTAGLAKEPAMLNVGTQTFNTDPVALGARVDADALADAALEARRGGNALARPFRWVGTFFSTVEVPVTYVIDEDQASAATAEFIEPLLAEPIEPQIGLVSGELIVTPGADGARLADGALYDEMPGMMAAGPPYEIVLEPLPLFPDVEDAALMAVADEANEATAEPVEFQVLADKAVIDGATVRTWVLLDQESSPPTWTIDQDAAVAELLPLFTGLGSDDQQARFDVSDGKPIIIPASESVICCDDDTADRIKQGLLGPPTPIEEVEGEEETEESTTEDPDADEDAEPELIPTRSIELAPRIAESDAGVAELEALGIIEEVATFTTAHKCCENRVKNIQLMADIVRGYVIEPGERFDLNDIVGRRTSANGFFPAGAIAQGVLEQQVGGGVSQFTTTMFNASFFGGLDFIEYQSHSLYFSRYPRGREATISFPKPDFIVENNTPYGVLVWPTYTDTSISVTLYSTKNVDVSCVKADGTLVQGEDGCDDAVRWGSQGACTRNTTVRQRDFADGRSIEDSVFAVYRPGEGLDCAGNSTRPTTVPADPDPDTTDTTAATGTTVAGDTTAPPTTATPTTAAPTTAPPTTAAPTTAPPSSDG